jgi:hypothetical protein
MTTLEWLLAGDPIIQRLVKIHVLDDQVDFNDDGLIKAYTDRFDPVTRRFGNGVYSPKWISTHYTLLELIDLEIDPTHPVVSPSIQTLLDGLWHPPHKAKNRWLDLCVAAMLVRMTSYAQIDDPRLMEMLTYVLTHAMPDGGYNCQWDRGAHKSSVHTTMSVIEAFDEVLKHPLLIDPQRIIESRAQAEAFLLRKHLVRSEHDGSIIHHSFIDYHYPPRWKYDVMRPLLHFALQHAPEDPAMTPWIDDLAQRMKNGTLPKGPKIGGLTHFPLEPGRGRGRFNTLRGLIVLKHFRPSLYKQVLDMPQKG